jgi:hypothetical protein
LASKAQELIGSYSLAGYPMGGYPMSGYPMSGYPMSGYPTSGYPMSGYSLGGCSLGGIVHMLIQAPILLGSHMEYQPLLLREKIKLEQKLFALFSWRVSFKINFSYIGCNVPNCSNTFSANRLFQVAWLQLT